MKNFPCHRQTDMATCGPTCLQNILEYWGYKVSVSELIRCAKTDNRGNSLYSLIQVAETYHLKAEPFSEGTIEDLTDNLKLPAIAHIIAQKTVEHYVVIYYLDEDYVYLSDPATGIRRMTKEAFCEEWTGHILCLSKDPLFRQKRIGASPLLPFLSALLESKAKLISITVLSILTLIVGTVPSYFYQVLTNQLIVDKNIRQLIGFTTLTLVLILVRGVFSYIRQKLLDWVSVQTDASITMNTISKVLRLPLPYLRSKAIGDWQARIYEVSNVSSAICSATLSIVIDSLMTVFGVWLLIRESVSLFMVVIVSAAIYVLITLVFSKRLKNHATQVVEHTNAENAYVTEILNGIPSIKANRLESICEQKAYTLRKQINTEKEKYNRTDNQRNSAMDIVSGTFEVLFLAIGGYLIIQGQLDLGTVLAFSSLTAYFYDPVLKLASMSAQLREASVSAQRLLDIWQENEEADPDVSKEFIRGNLAFRNVTFAYGYREPILENLTFEIRDNQITALIGENGSGKSTTAQLLCGLYTPSSGNIVYGSIELNQIKHSELRQHIIYVPQQTFLFKASIRENLLGNLTNIADEEIWALCNSVQIQERIQELPLGLDTVLSENGYDFSGGERQKLALVRALLQKPDCLILDESMSAMDRSSRQAVCTLLNDLKKQMMIIIITHQSDVIEYCNDVVLLRYRDTALWGTKDVVSSHQVYRQLVNA